MPKQKSKVKKAAKKEAVKEVKKILRKKGPRRARRAANILHGRGGYWGDIGKRLGGHLGGAVDEVAGLAKVFTGRGSYNVKRNSLYESGAPPAIVNSKHTNIIRHQEYLGDVLSSVAFKNQVFSFNPGVATTFPWLAKIAQSYTQWECLGAVVSFRSRCLDAISSTTNNAGTVIIASEYNSNLPPFQDKLSMENHEYRSPGKPTQNILHPIECAPKFTTLEKLYVRSSNSSVVYDPLFYDLCQINVATVGMQTDNVNIGELWIDYEIQFYKPQMDEDDPAQNSVHLYWDSSLGPAFSSGSPALFQNTRDKLTGIVHSTPNTVSVPPGTYWSILYIGTNAGGTWTNTPVSVTGVSGSPPWYLTNPSTGVAAGIALAFGFGSSAGSIHYFSALVSNNTTQVQQMGYSLPQYNTNLPTSIDFLLIPYTQGNLFAPHKSRKAVDWDPIAVLSRKLASLEERLGQPNCDDEKYSECSTPIHVEPEFTASGGLSQSTADLATSLLSRLQLREPAVTKKTAFPNAA